MYNNYDPHMPVAQFEEGMVDVYQCQYPPQPFLQQYPVGQNVDYYQPQNVVYVEPPYFQPYANIPQEPPYRPRGPRSRGQRSRGRGQGQGQCHPARSQGYEAECYMPAVTGGDYVVERLRNMELAEGEPVNGYSRTAAEQGAGRERGHGTRPKDRGGGGGGRGRDGPRREGRGRGREVSRGQDVRPRRNRSDDANTPAHQGVAESQEHVALQNRTQNLQYNAANLQVLGRAKDNRPMERMPTSQAEGRRGAGWNEAGSGRAWVDGRGRGERGRGGRGSKNSRGRNASRAGPIKTEEDDETQRGSLIEQLSRNKYECMVCCDIVSKDAAIWHCSNCFHVFHLRCIKKWASSPASVTDDGGGWRCPACQNLTKGVPYQYKCFCGKIRDPEYTRRDTPHSCGEVCGKQRRAGCIHRCNILCHPGPCPPCHATVTKQCDCGRSKQTIMCGQSNSVKCSATCLKTLNCGKHECQEVCHPPPCSPCEVAITQGCFCGAEQRVVVCGAADSFVSSYCCVNKCHRSLPCGNHTCDRGCHPGVCESCPLLPSAVLSCPCGKTLLTELTSGGGERQSCTDPIPVCDKLCGRPLQCGPPDAPHTCPRECHQGECGLCDGITMVTCVCGAFTKDMPCREAAKYNGAEPFKCEKRCNKKRECGKHKCGQLCCVDSEHKCDLICGRKLSCGLHRCEEPCHRGNCPTCWQVSFDELYCHCGEEVLYPPVACGTKPPECPRTCSREHGCNHTVRHPCHIEATCPPCTELTEKWCMGRHELRKNIVCHLIDISCGLPCNKALPCSIHKCLQVCHKGDCLAAGVRCSQPCSAARDDCGHPCMAPCHVGTPCPKTTCRVEVALTCECGHRTERMTCMQTGEYKADFQKLAPALLAKGMQDGQDGQSIDMSSLMKETNKKKPRKLACSSECSVIERNKRMALALEIKNPDLTGKLGNPVYSQFLKDSAKQFAGFVSGIEKALSDLVQSAQGSKQSKRSHAFSPMNQVQRRVVHELAEFYGCETQSYDQEPKKNVVATAFKGRCWLPSVTLTSLVQRDLHHKPPLPIPHNSTLAEVRSIALAAKQSTKILDAWDRPRKSSALTSSSTWATKTGKGPGKAAEGGSAGTTSTSAPKAKPQPDIDYFDMTG